MKAIDIVDLGLGGTQCRLVSRHGERPLQVPLLGRGNLSNVLCAAAVALELGVPLDTVAARAAVLTPARRRGEVRSLGSGVTVVDDTYNSSPSALRRALEMLSLHTPARRRVAVLGEMLELGERALDLHQACGRAAAAAHLDVLVTVGGDAARALGEAAVAAGMDAATVRHVATSAEAAEVAASGVRPGDVVLVKGSRGVGTELVVDRLVAVCG